MPESKAMTQPHQTHACAYMHTHTLAQKTRPRHECSFSLHVFNIVLEVLSVY